MTERASADRILRSFTNNESSSLSKKITSSKITNFQRSVERTAKKALSFKNETHTRMCKLVFL